MRLAFAGTPAFAAESLAALLRAGHDICLVISQPDRPRGRGLHASASPVATLAMQAGLRVARPESMADPGFIEQLRVAAPEVLVVAAYGRLLPKPALTLPTRGCLNVHASLLPRWRGAAPVQRAILAGDQETGISIMQMEAGLDTGPVLLRRAIPIAPDDTGGSLTARLATLGGEAIVVALRDIDRLPPVPQPQEGVTYAAKLSRAEATLDWRDSAEHLARQVRAFDPYPGTETLHAGARLKVWAARPVLAPFPQARPGTVVGEDGGCPIVACGKGALALVELQRPGGRRLAAAELARGHAFGLGSAFGE